MKTKEQKEYMEKVFDEAKIETFFFGPFTIAIATNCNVKGYGISRCSSVDSFDGITGASKAIGRAKKALWRKKTGRRLPGKNQYYG